MVIREGEKNAYHGNDEKNNENDDIEKSSQLVTNSDPVLDRAIFDRYVRNYILWYLLFKHQDILLSYPRLKIYNRMKIYENKNIIRSFIILFWKERIEYPKFFLEKWQHSIYNYILFFLYSFLILSLLISLYFSFSYLMFFY